MQRPAPSPDHSSTLAFIAFAAAATIWIGVMAVQPKAESLRASVIVMPPNIAMVWPQPQLPVMRVADLSR